VTAARVAQSCLAATRLVWQQRCSASQAAALAGKTESGDRRKPSPAAPAGGLLTSGSCTSWGK